MATITDKTVVDDLIKNEGWYSDPEAEQALGPAVRIVEYKTPEGVVNWGVVYLIEARMGLLMRYDKPTQYVNEPKAIWSHPHHPSARPPLEAVPDAE